MERAWGEFRWGAEEFVAGIEIIGRKFLGTQLSKRALALK
jgi:hypothetical protein